MAVAERRNLLSVDILRRFIRPRNNSQTYCKAHDTCSTTICIDRVRDLRCFELAGTSFRMCSGATRSNQVAINHRRRGLMPNLAGIHFA